MFDTFISYSLIQFFKKIQTFPHFTSDETGSIFTRAGAQTKRFIQKLIK